MTWYDSLDKPAWNPPASWFSPVWTGLYLAMAAAAVIVLIQAGIGKEMGVFTLQLLLNLAWPVVFFGQHRLWWSIIIVALVPLIALCMVLFWRVSPIAGALMAPYLVWVTYAATLNIAIAIKN